MPGRNDPCPCGSGKKYKKCCINDAERGKPDRIDPTRAAVALELHYAVHTWEVVQDELEDPDLFYEFSVALLGLSEDIGLSTDWFSNHEALALVQAYIFFGQHVGRAANVFRKGLSFDIERRLEPLCVNEFGAWQITGIRDKTLTCRRLKSKEDPVIEVDILGFGLLDLQCLRVGTTIVGFRKSVAEQHVFLFPMIMDEQTSALILDTVETRGWRNDEAYHHDLILLVVGVEWDYWDSSHGRRFKESRPKHDFRRLDLKDKVDTTVSTFSRLSVVPRQWIPHFQAPSGPMIEILSRAGVGVPGTNLRGQQDLEQRTTEVQDFLMSSFEETRDLLFTHFGLDVDGNIQKATSRWHQTPLYALELDWASDEVRAFLEKTNLDPGSKLGDIKFGKTFRAVALAAEYHRHWCRWVTLLPRVEETIWNSTYYVASEERIQFDNVIAGLGFVKETFLDLTLEEIGLDGASLRRLARVYALPEEKLTPRHVMMSNTKLRSLPGIGKGTANMIQKVIRESLMAFADREPDVRSKDRAEPASDTHCTRR